MYNKGQSVVCINDNFDGIENLYYRLPRRGEVYHIRDICRIYKDDDDDILLIYLSEIQSPIEESGMERGFKAERFELYEPEESDGELSFFGVK